MIIIFIIIIIIIISVIIVLIIILLSTHRFLIYLWLFSSSNPLPALLASASLTRIQLTIFLIYHRVIKAVLTGRVRKIGPDIINHHPSFSFFPPILPPSLLVTLPVFPLILLPSFFFHPTYLRSPRISRTWIRPRCKGRL